VSDAAKFDLGLYKSGTTKTVTANKPGLVEVYCNIHPEMSAKVLVLETTFWDTTETDGSFRIDGVPPGTWRYVAWHAWGPPVKGNVRVEAGGEARLALTLVDKGKPRHVRKDGRPYGRYR
jgi:hypothetical protein